MSKLVFSFVPIQNFSETSDIDWDAPIINIERQLYEKYELSEDEINFIETKVKEID